MKSNMENKIVTLLGLLFIEDSLKIKKRPNRFLEYI
jgi:hypothetical protein